MVLFENKRTLNLLRDLGLPEKLRYEISSRRGDDTTTDMAFTDKVEITLNSGAGNVSVTTRQDSDRRLSGMRVDVGHGRS